MLTLGESSFLDQWMDCPPLGQRFEIPHTPLTFFHVVIHFTYASSSSSHMSILFCHTSLSPFLLLHPYLEVTELTIATIDDPIEEPELNPKTGVFHAARVEEDAWCSDEIVQ